MHFWKKSCVSCLTSLWEICLNNSKKCVSHHTEPTEPSPAQWKANLLQLHPPDALPEKHNLSSPPVQIASPPLTLLSHNFAQLLSGVRYKFYSWHMWRLSVVPLWQQERTGDGQLHYPAIQQQLLKPTVIQSSRFGPVMEELCNVLWQRKAQSAARNGSFG